MNGSVADRFTQLQSVLDLAEQDVMVSEVHGILVGALVNHFKSEQAPNLLALVIPESDGVSKYSHLKDVLYEIYREISEELLSGEQGFSLLLVDDDERLELRVESLAAWCKGYLLGLLYNNTFSVDQLSDSSAEIIRDIMQISEASAGLDDEREEDWALAELEEYIKVGVQLIFENIYSEYANKTPTTKH